ncbi:MAG TPA: Fur family transcriptional regulator [Chloroflexota bacterium]|nr:Fur family transcriptional regulator [Chloroflexota bacterium]
MRTIPELIEKIHARGGKVTPQRLAIYQALEADTTHPTAEAIYERIRETMPTVSLATVYKTLNELVAIGELRRFDIHGVSHFDPRTDPHAEVVCLGCDVIMDVFSPAAVPAPSIPGFQIVGQTQTFYGYCPNCQNVQQPLD